MLNFLIPYISIIRPKHVVKNFIVFLPLFFSENLFNTSLVSNSIYAFFIFCILSFIVYIFNDLLDFEKDLLHPQKKYRPIPSGKISRLFATYFLIFWLVLFFLVIYNFSDILLFSILYLVLNFAYSTYLKKFVIFDIFTISLMYCLRVGAGAQAISVDLSSWMILTIFFSSLYLIIVKRMVEKRNFSVSRSVLNDYNDNTLKTFSIITAISSINFYCFYVVLVNETLIYSIPFIVFGFFRYYYLIDTKKIDESPIENIFDDKILVLIILLWFLSVLRALYF